jgi:hypothetical protein
MADDTERKAPPEAKPTALRRWAVRKSAAQHPTVPPVPAEPPARVLTDADMPPIESLGKDSEYGMFFSPGVSESLRTRALQKLFRCGLYDELCPLESEYYDFRGEEVLETGVAQKLAAAVRAAERPEESSRGELIDEGKPVTAAAATEKQATPPTESLSVHEPETKRSGVRRRTAKGAHHGKRS